MGVNHTIVRIPKSLAKKYQFQSYEEMDNTHLLNFESKYSLIDLFLENQVYYLGKEVTTTLEDSITKESFFKDELLQKAWSENTFKVLHEDAFLRIANYFEKAVYEELATILTDYDRENEYKPSPINPIKDEDIILKNEAITREIVKYFVRDFQRLESGIRTSRLSVLNKNEKDDRIVNSAAYKYEMFECIRLYKEFIEESSDYMFILITS